MGCFATKLPAYAKRYLLPFLITLQSFHALSQPAVNVRAWGDNSLGQCNVPPDLTNAVAIAAGAGYSLALRANGTVTEWGKVPFLTMPAMTNVVAISAGTYHRLAVLADGSVRGWGDCNHPYCFSYPSNLNNVWQVAAGNDFSVALRNDRTMLIWGFLDCSQGVPPGTNFIAVAAGMCGLALRDNGTVAPLGSGFFGVYAVPADLTNAVAIATGSQSYGLAIRANGNVVGWGTVGGSTPVNVPSSFTNVAAISTFPGLAQYTLALRHDGSVVDSGLPVPGDLPYATAVAAGGGHGLAIINPSAVIDPPTILAQPQSRSVAVGASVTLSVRAAGFGPFSYQWFFNSTNVLSGETNSNFAIAHTQASQSGAYSVAVSNPGGTTLSQPAIITISSGLDINMAPAITVFGFAGKSYRLEYTYDLNSTNWIALTTLALTNNPQIYVDLSGIGQPRRFYRSVELP